MLIRAIVCATICNDSFDAPLFSNRYPMSLQMSSIIAAIGVRFKYFRLNNEAMNLTIAD